MAGKRRFIGPSGGIFVPNVPEDTIAQHIKDGIWTPVKDDAPAEPVKPVKRAYTRK